MTSELEWFEELLQPRIIYHIPVNSLKNSMINAPLVGLSEFITTKTNVQMATDFNDSNKIHTLPQVIGYPSKFFLHKSYNIVITNSTPRIVIQSSLLNHFFPKSSPEVIFAFCINQRTIKLLLQFIVFHVASDFLLIFIKNITANIIAPKNINFTITITSRIFQI